MSGGWHIFTRSVDLPIILILPHLTSSSVHSFRRDHTIHILSRSYTHNAARKCHREGVPARKCRGEPAGNSPDEISPLPSNSKRCHPCGHRSGQCKHSCGRRRRRRPLRDPEAEGYGFVGLAAPGWSLSKRRLGSPTHTPTHTPPHTPPHTPTHTPPQPSFTSARTSSARKSRI